MTLIRPTRITPVADTIVLRFQSPQAFSLWVRTDAENTRVVTSTMTDRCPRRADEIIAMANAYRALTGSMEGFAFPEELL